MSCSDQVSGRVVIDAFAYYRSCNIVKPDLRSLFDGGEKYESLAKADRSDEGSSTSSNEAESMADGPELTAVIMAESVSRCEDFRSLADEHCLLATPWLKGLELKTKEWGKNMILHHQY